MSDAPTHSIEFELTDPRQLFTVTPIDPLSTQYTEFTARPAIDTVRDLLIASPPPSNAPIELVVTLPPEVITPRLDEELTDAVRRWSRVDGAIDRHRNAAAGSIGRRLSVLALIAFVAVQTLTIIIRRFADGVDNDVLAAAAEGVSVVGWVLLWFPLDSIFMEVLQRSTRRRLTRMFDRVSVRVRPRA